MVSSAREQANVAQRRSRQRVRLEQRGELQHPSCHWQCAAGVMASVQPCRPPIIIARPAPKLELELDTAVKLAAIAAAAAQIAISAHTARQTAEAAAAQARQQSAEELEAAHASERATARAAARAALDDEWAQLDTLQTHTQKVLESLHANAQQQADANEPTFKINRGVKRLWTDQPAALRVQAPPPHAPPPCAPPPRAPPPRALMPPLPLQSKNVAPGAPQRGHQAMRIFNKAKLA